MKEVQIQRYRVCSLARKRLCVLCQTKMATTTQVASSARQLARAALHKARPSPTAALAKPVKKHEKLAKTLAWLTREPKPILGQIASLELIETITLARGMCKKVYLLANHAVIRTHQVSLPSRGMCPY
jgi:hypothetical protein